MNMGRNTWNSFSISETLENRSLLSIWNGNWDFLTFLTHGIRHFALICQC